MEHLSFVNTIEALRRQLNINANPMTMPDFNFSDSDICCDLGNDPEPKFLDEYTEEDFHKILNENGFIEDLKKLGYSKTILRMECKDKFVHRLSLLDRSLMTSVDQPITEKNFLMDMFMRKKELVTYQLKAYQDLKYRANHMPSNEAEEIDILPDIPEKRKFKPEYMKDSREKKKEKTLKLRNLSDFRKVDDNKLKDNLKEANNLSSDNNSIENNELKNLTPPSPTKSTSSYNFSMYSLGRTFSLNRNPSITHGSTVDVDVIEVSSASSYSEDDEKKENNKNVIKRNTKSSLSNTGDENEDIRSNSTASSLDVEIHNDQEKNELNQEVLKSNSLGNKVDEQKLPLYPNEKLSKNEHNSRKVNPDRVLRRPNKHRSKDYLNVSKDENKHSSLDFSYFINSLTFGNNSNSNKRNSNQPPMTASSVINSIFSFLNNSIKEEKPIAPIIDTPKSPSIPESSQESSVEMNPDDLSQNGNTDNDIADSKDQLVDEKKENNNINIISPSPVRIISTKNYLDSPNIESTINKTSANNNEFQKDNINNEIKDMNKNKDENKDENKNITENGIKDENKNENKDENKNITENEIKDENKNENMDENKNITENESKDEIKDESEDKNENINENKNKDENKNKNKDENKNITEDENKDENRDKIKDENENKNEKENEDEDENENNSTSIHSSRNIRPMRTNAGMDMELQPKSPEEVRKRKLTPLLVSKKGAMVLIKFLERNINVIPEMKITEIEWVCMQNPRGTFTTKRPQCPGQRFPGLKMGRKISNLMISLAKLRGRDGLCDTPEHFHNAAIYSQKGYMFINPAFHGYFVSLLYDLNKDMREHGLAAVSWAFKLGHVINRKTKKPEFWHPEEQIYPTSDRLHKYFISDQYLTLVEHYRKVHLGRVYIDWNEAKECLAYSIKIEQIQHIVFSDNENEEEDKENQNEENIKEENLVKKTTNQSNSTPNDSTEKEKNENN